MEEELVIDPVKAQFSALLYFLPVLIVSGLAYFLLWESRFSTITFKNFLSASSGNFLLIFLIILIGIILHELIHGITWSLFAATGFKSIRFGVLWKYLTPYCHCKEPLLVKHYILGGAMPGIIMGILPILIALITGNLTLLVFGLFFSLAAGGDLMIINLLRKQDMNTRVQDHPTKIGCILYKQVTTTGNDQCC